MTNISDYNARLEIVSVQFQLVRLAMSRLSRAEVQRFFHELKQRELDSLRSVFGAVKDFIPENSNVDGEALVEMLMKGEKTRVSRKFSRKNQNFYQEFTENGINASELLIRVAHFEAFMKEIHAGILNAQPSLSGKIRPNRQVTLKDVFSPATFGDFTKQEIYREVDEVDRKRVKERAKYFETHLKIRWAEPPAIELLKDVMDIRNQLSHERPDHPVSSTFLEKAANVLREIPQACFSKAQKLYPTQFH